MFKDVDATINKLKNGKVPGLNGILPEAYKAMNSQTSRRVHQNVAAIIDGDKNYKVCHKSKCIPVPKTGNLADHNKWQGVMLVYVCSKIFFLRHDWPLFLPC
jgi:hypothetical protein